jgi:hypothetical protein
MITDIERSKEFYAKLFGWAAETQGEGLGQYTELKAKGRSIAGMMPKPAMVPEEVPPKGNRSWYRPDRGGFHLNTEARASSPSIAQHRPPPPGLAPSRAGCLGAPGQRRVGVR